MNFLPRIRFALIAAVALVSWASSGRADNGTVVSGTVIAIDVPNQIMRVYVTAVNGQSLVGGPDTNYVDYLVAPNTAVYNYNNQIISQSNVQVGTRIQMQFQGAYASQILVFSSIGIPYSTSYSGVIPNYATGYVQNFPTIQNYSAYRQPYVQSTQVTHFSNPFPTLNLNHVNLHRNASSYSFSHSSNLSHHPNHATTGHSNHLQKR